MDPHKVLIKTYQRQRWEVKTESIKEIVELDGKYEITFNSGKTFTYGIKKVKYFADPEELNIEQSIVRIQGKDSQHWDAAKVFGPYICLYKNEYTQVEHKSEVEFVPNISLDVSVKRLRDYYQYIADFIKNKTAHLDYYYINRLGIIREDSVLSKYIDRLLPGKMVTDIPLFPFGINLSQRKAVFNALGNQISLIQGPPGTGKTQTILNIIANLIFQKKTVAIVAGNNSATDNVFEKLEALGLGFIVAKLGRSELQKEFFSLEHTLPDIAEWAISKEESDALYAKIKKINEILITLMEARNKYAMINESISRLVIEKHYFDKHFSISPINPKIWSFSSKWATPNLLAFLAELEYYSQFDKVRLPTKLRWLFKYHIYKFKDLKTIDDSVTLGIVSEFYNIKLNEWKQERQELKTLLDDNNFEDLLGLYTKTSLQIFRGHIARHYGEMDNVSWDDKTYRYKFTDFMTRFPVLLSTTDSIINNKSQFELFDYVIVDESSQVDLVTGFLTMSCAKNMVAVGDLNQLPHIPNEEIAKSAEEIDSKFGIEPCYSYIHESLLSSITNVFSDVAPTTLLVEHYRCHPRIIDFCNQKFYDGKLVTMTEASHDPFRVLKTVKGKHARRPSSGKSLINIRELDVIENEVLNDYLKNEPNNTIGIASPYRAQVEMAREHLSLDDVKIDTVYKYQGREKENIVFTTTANYLNKFVDNPNLLNVAVSRAISRFVLVTSGNSFKKQGSNLGDLIRHIEYQSLSPSIFESKVVSIFDCLYKEYSDVLKDFLKSVKKKSKFPSENLMAALLDEFLATPPFKSFSYQMNYTLNLLISDYSQFSNREEQYARNPNTHVDFLVFNKLDKLPVLAIEVDGYKYHELNEKQKERDKLKNQFFTYFAIPLLRFSSVGSSERGRLEKALTTLLMDIPESEDEKLRTL